MEGLNRLIDEKDPSHEEYAFFCPGCKCGHSFIVKWGAGRLKWRKEVSGAGEYQTRSAADLEL